MDQGLGLTLGFRASDGLRVLGFGVACFMNYSLNSLKRAMYGIL